MLKVELTGIPEVVNNLLRYEVEQRMRLRLACKEVAQLLERYAITHHPWNVLTGATNITTRGTWEELTNDLYEVVLSAGMDYDVFLEGKTATGEDSMPQYRRFAWIWPAIAANHHEIIGTFARHLKH